MQASWGGKDLKHGLSYCRSSALVLDCDVCQPDSVPESVFPICSSVALLL